MNSAQDIELGLDVTTIELPADDQLLEALSEGLGNTEIGASGVKTGSWLV